MTVKTMYKKALGLLMCTTLLSVPTFASETISFRSDYWCPYICNPNSDKPGYMVEVLRKVFEPQGYKLDIQLQSWVKAIAATRTNESNALMGASPIDGPDFIFPKQPLGLMRNAFFVRRDSKWSYQGAASLAGQKIGVINSYTYGEGIDPLIKQKHTSFYVVSGKQPLESVVRMAHTGRLDAFVESPDILPHTTAQTKKYLRHFRFAGWVEIAEPELYVLFSPKNPKSKVYAQILDEGITKLRASGELKRILDRYEVYDWDRTQMQQLGVLNDFGTGIFQGPLYLLNVLDTRRF